MGFLNTDSMPRLVEKLSDGDNIRISGNSKGNRVGTVVKKIVEKADDVTKAIEQEVVNDGYSFKVGTGNVDVSADVEDGFGEVGVKGIALQNCYPLLITSNFSRLNGTITSDGYVSMQGDGANWKNAWISIDKCLIKPNTNYTLVCYVLENTLVEGLSLTSSSEQCVFRTTNKVPAKTTGLMYYSLRSIDDFTSVLYGLRSYLSNTETGKIVFKVMILEGDHTNNPNLPSYFEGIQGVGDKSKNLFDITNSTIGKYLQGNIGSGYGTYGESSVSDISDYIPVVANKTYVFSYDFKKLLGTGDRGYCFYNENKELITSNKNTLYSSTSKKLILTPSVNGYVRVCYDKNCLDIQLEEGSTATSYEPYYDGHKIEILSDGKNLVNRILGGDINSDDYSLMNVTEKYQNMNTNLNTAKLIKYQKNGVISFKGVGVDQFDNQYNIYLNPKVLKPNTTYIFSWEDIFATYELDLSKDYKYNRFSVIINGKEIRVTNPTKIIEYTTPSIVESFSFNMWFNFNGESLAKSKTLFGNFVNLQIEESPTPTPYTPYIEDKTQILLDEPLMRLPNGVCDEITRDGKLIRRVGKIVFDGTENWTGFKTHFEDFDEFSGNVGNHTILQNNSIVNNFPQTNHHRVVTAGNTTYIRLPKGRVNSLNECKQWLSQNPTTVYYELSTPIITELPAPYLRIFKDGHLTFNTLVAPESNHVVQLNKSAQIERSIREVQSLDSRVGKLESFYDDMMLETSHKLSLLNYDFEYTRERNGE